MTEPLPIYLGPNLPRWTPRTANDVQRAIDDGLLGETHWIDVKLEVAKADNKETARDMASYAIDGGAIIVGIREDKKAGTMKIEPVDLRGLPERLDEIARSRCDRPLYIQCRPLPVDAADPTRGLLLVEIPPSAMAPHMVDGRYYGRGDTTKRILTDAEVDRLHAARRVRSITAEQVIRDEIARDPIPLALRQRGHIYVVAQPLATPPDWLTDAIERKEVGLLVRELAARIPAVASPPLHFASNERPRAQGLGLSSHGLSGRRLDPATREDLEGGTVDLEVADDGRISFFCGRGTDDTREAAEQYVVDAAVAMYVRGAVELAGHLGSTFTYGGRWLLAVGVTEVGGKLPLSSFNVFGAMSAQPFSAEYFLEATESVTAELVQRPGSVTQRLIRRLLRGLGADGRRYEPLLSDSSTT